jgi:hypothetical protein
MKLLLFFAAVALVPGDANACAWLTPAGVKAQQAEHNRYLRKNSNKVVFGTWSLLSTGQTEHGGPMIYGVVTSPTKHGKFRFYQTYHSNNEINCGFPFLPENGARGTFWLDGDRDSDYRLVHFSDSVSRR